MQKKCAVRWVIKDHGEVVQTVYSSEKAAIKWANRYAEGEFCCDEPYFPLITIEEEYLEE